MGFDAFLEEIAKEVLAELEQRDHPRLAGPGGESASPGTAKAVPKANLAAMIDHTLLKPEATKAEIERLCEEAKQYSFWSVCINPGNVRLAAKLLRGSGVKVSPSGPPPLWSRPWRPGTPSPTAPTRWTW